MAAKKSLSKAKKARKPKVAAIKEKKPRKKRQIKKIRIEKPFQNVEKGKYYSSPAVEKFEGAKGFELPQEYNDNYIILMVRDPYWIYAYWEINLEKINKIRSELGHKFDQTKLILRAYNVQNWDFFDINVPNRIGNWYINVGRSNAAYCADIGFLTADGIFICAARSNIVATPRDGMSEVIDEEWMIPDWERMYALSGGFRVGHGSFELKEMMEKRLLRQISSGG